MPIFRLNEHIQFPHPEYAEDNGLLAIGGDLRPERLLMAYSQGIFPWYSIGDPILWWFTSPRLVLFPAEFRVPKRLGRYARNASFSITRDRAFSRVISECAEVRTERRTETWITPEMQEAYTRLHHLGFAHSVECWQDDLLIGGLYGIALDKVFFGESMFSRTKCASQFALIALVEYLQSRNFQMIDCQMTTDHLLRFGAREISGKEFRRHLKEHIKNIIPYDDWNNES
ncbi:leucyl/phenylalanyl-tRNA--protein transferase [Desulfopila sp. IMCC35006]|uniref:leucyl/phenylalanyl-tRNA--protein transferase n=1 Tax=Desulfopila sp. IMCC35006 TaxID=2569542 RepID=UPI0010AC969D|nr:leucyl/phenylalanyl-tRNA--protein transferase [Desulfopila sp. IMCC35006]TKB23554.1 leucyl/phenylalanyl-tRNA--protein transferase [Desulfopila sp. IMCC35006]